MKKLQVIFILFIWSLSGCTMNGDSEAELTISAAASLTDSLTELNKALETEHPEIEVFSNFGGSGSLRKQIEQGAPIDVFLSASRKDYEVLVDKGMVDKGKAFLTNNLVLITGQEKEVGSFEMFLDGEGLLAIGTPETVPAGSYAREVLQNLNKWKLLEEQNRFVFTKDVTQVLTLVKEGAADFGIVYSSDVFQDQGVKIIHEFDSSLHEPIHYYIAVIDNGEDSETMKQVKNVFYDYVSSETAMEIFEKRGLQRVE